MAIAYAQGRWIHDQLQLYAANSLQARYLIHSHADLSRTFAYKDDTVARSSLSKLIRRDKTRVRLYSGSFDSSLKLTESSRDRF